MQTGGVRSEGAVAEEVACGTGQAEFGDDVSLAELSPIADDLGPGLAVGQVQERLEVGTSRDVRSGHLVDRGYAELGCPGARGALGHPALLGRDGGNRRASQNVMGIEPQMPALIESVEVLDFRAALQQCCRDDGGVHVHSGEVGSSAASGPVEFAEAWCSPFGPSGLVPAGAEDQLTGMDLRVRRDPLQRSRQGRCAVQIQPAQ